MDHPLVKAPAGIPASRHAWSTISSDAVASLHVATRISIEEGTSVVVRRDLLGGIGGTFGSVVDVSLGCADEELARHCLEAAKKLTSSDAVTGTAILILGGDWFAERVTYAAAVMQEERIAADRAAIEEAERDAALARQIDVYFKGGKKEPRVELRRGNSPEPIWSITFGEVWERERFWDWLKWQRPRFDAFVTELEAEGAMGLRSRLLREMLETEQAARRNKLATTGRRPLRFWCGEVA